jgi:hypothetical protein
LRDAIAKNWTWLSVRIVKYDYVINIAELKQTNYATWRSRRIRRKEDTGSTRGPSGDAPEGETLEQWATGLGVDVRILGTGSGYITPSKKVKTRVKHSVMQRVTHTLGNEALSQQVEWPVIAIDTMFDQFKTPLL